MLTKIRSAFGAVLAPARSVLMFAFAVALVILCGTEVQAAVPTEITEMTTNADTVFTSVKGIVLAVVGFFILLGIVKLVRRR